MEKVLVAGATGYLGGFIVRELKKRGYYVIALTRDESRLDSLREYIDDERTGQVTRPDTLRNICEGVDYVFSSIGITRQKDGMTYQDVDYQGNLNLLRTAESSNVKKFIYISVLNGEKLKKTELCEAKEKFVSELKKSGLNSLVIRPNGFFSDMSDFLKMAQGGNVYLFGDGELKMNPIHGEDLAVFCVDAIHSEESDLEIGGPDMLTQNEIAKMALEAAGKKVKVRHFPDWTRRLALTLIKTFTSSKTYGPVEFFLTVMSIDMVAPTYGKYHLKDFFIEEIETMS